MVAIFLDHNKPKTSLKKWIHPVSNFIHLIQFHLICQMLTKFSVVESKRTVSKFRKRKRKILCCVHWHSISGCVKLGTFRLQLCNNGWKMYKKVWCMCIHIVVVLLYKPTAFLPFLLLSPLSLLKLPIIVIQKFCHHCNVMTHFSSLLCYWNKVYSTLFFCKHLMINGAIAQNRCFFSRIFRVSTKWTWNTRHTRWWFDHWSGSPSFLFSRKKKKRYLITGHFGAFSCHECLRLYLHFVLCAQKYCLLCRLQRCNRFHLLTASSFFTSLTNVLTFSPRADLDRILLRCFCATTGDGAGDTLLPSADSCTFATEN